MLFEPCFEKYNRSFKVNDMSDDFKSVNNFAKRLKTNFKHASFSVSVAKVIREYNRVFKVAISAKTPEQKKRAIREIDLSCDRLYKMAEDADREVKYAVDTPYDNIHVHVLVKAAKLDFRIMQRILEK